jgi:hypothetical protein
MPFCFTPAVFLSIFENLILKQMNKLIIAFILLTSNLYAQKVSLEVHDMAAGQTYYAYLLANNDIVAMVENLSCDSFFLTTNNGTIERDEKDNCVYHFRPEKWINTSIYYKKIVKKDTITFNERKVYVRPWPFMATFNGHIGGDKGILDLKKIKLIEGHITVESINTGLSAFCPIKSFNLKIKRCSKIIYEKDFKKYNREIIDNIHKDFAQLQSDDIVIFSKIYYDYFGTDLESKDLIINVK